MQLVAWNEQEPDFTLRHPERAVHRPVVSSLFPAKLITVLLIHGS